MIKIIRKDPGTELFSVDTMLYLLSKNLSKEALKLICDLLEHANHMSIDMFFAITDNDRKMLRLATELIDKGLLEIPNMKCMGDWIDEIILRV